jgi:hypothetical protein
MKALAKISLDMEQCKKDLADFKTLLDSTSVLSERNDLLPFFRSHPHLAALVGSFWKSSAINACDNQIVSSWKRHSMRGRPSSVW